MYFLANICENPDFLRVIYFGIRILRIVFLIVPIALIVLITMDVFKMITASDDKDTKKGNKTIITRLIFAVLMFFVPTIVSAVMNLLSTSGINSDYIKCLENASSLEKINKLENSGGGNTNVNNGSGKEEEESDNESSTTTEHQYFAPIQGISYNKGSYSNTPGCSNDKVYHDISGVAEGTPIYAGMNGEAWFYQNYCSTNNELYSYGNVVRLTGNDGTYIIYAHLQKFPDEVTKASTNDVITKTCPKKSSSSGPCPASSCGGDIKQNTIIRKQVKKGDIIGYLGNTGNSTGAHLHVEIHTQGKKLCVENPWKSFGMEK